MSNILSQGRRDLATKLFNLLVANPTGLSTEQVARELDVSSDRFHDAKTTLHIMLGGSDSLTVIGTPAYGGEGWTWMLKGYMGDPAVEEFRLIKQARLITYLKVALAITSSLAANKSLTPLEQRSIDEQHKAMRRLLEDAQDLRDRLEGP